MAAIPLEFEDLSLTCRRDRFCQTCVRAFCSRCCGSHHHNQFCDVIPVDVDAGGRPIFTTTFEFAPGQDWLRDIIVGTIAAEDYATRLPRNAYCVGCMQIFCTDDSPQYRHHRGCERVVPDAVLHVEKAGNGTLHCVRCTGSVPWFPYVESILGDPVDEGEDEQGQYQFLLPVLRRAPDRCVQCGAQVPRTTPRKWYDYHPQQHCSEPCATEHGRVVAQRRERREARLAAGELAKLQIN